MCKPLIPVRDFAFVRRNFYGYTRLVSSPFFKTKFIRFGNPETFLTCKNIFVNFRDILQGLFIYMLYTREWRNGGEVMMVSCATKRYFLKYHISCHSKTGSLFFSMRRFNKSFYNRGDFIPNNPNRDKCDT